MKHLRTLETFARLAGLVAVLPLAFGCAARSAPFDQMDRAQITVLRLAQAQPATPQAGALPTIPGLPPEIQAMGQQALQGLGGVLPPGILPPGLIPNQPGGQSQPATQQFKGFSIVAEMPLSDERMKDDLLDVFGHESNFSNQRGNCFTPGLGVVMQRPNAPEVNLLISLSCNQAMMDGARWPYPVNGFTQEARADLSKIYERLFGPVPPGA